MAFESLMNRLGNDREVILPFFELGMMADDWPDEYNIPVDSRPYYGAGDGMFHPSTHPLMGVRQLYYRFHPDTRDKMVPERRTLKNHMILSQGSALHAVLQTQMEMTGLVKSKDDIEIEYTIPEHMVRGRIDWLAHIPGTDEQWYVEMKTINEWGYKSINTKGVIKPEWDAQLSMGEYAMGVDKGLIVMVERGGQFQMREFRHQRNDALLEEIFTKFAYVRECIEKNEPPRHCCMPDSPEMGKCAARFSCWLKEEK